MSEVQLSDAAGSSEAGDIPGAINRSTEIIETLQSELALAHENRSKERTRGLLYKNLLGIVLHSTFSLEEIRELISSNAAMLKEETHHLDHSSKSFVEAADFMSELVVSIAKISEDTESAKTTSERCRNLTANVSGLASEIEEISSQTNLIAINASVEAARAGDAGRGFGVIAHEVRDLAMRAKQASVSINEFVSEIGTGVTQAYETIDAVTKQLSTVSDSAAQLASTMGDSNKTAARMVDVLRDTASRTFIRTVKLDHVVWKNAVYRNIDGISNAPASDFADHTQCRLGKWYLGEGKVQLGTTPAFRQLEAPHRRVHLSGIRALQAKEDKNRKACINELREMESASEEVMRKLSELELEMLSDGK
jgi:hypothetical protein